MGWQAEPFPAKPTPLPTRCHPVGLPLRQEPPEAKPVRRGQRNPAHEAKARARVTQPPPSPRGRPALPVYQPKQTFGEVTGRLWTTTPAVDNSAANASRR